MYVPSESVWEKNLETICYCKIYNPKISYYKTKYQFQSFKFLAYLLDLV